MSFNSFFSNLPEPLRQPNRLGIIASLGFHGVLFGVLPFLSLSKANESRRVVNLVQLSPAEQNRVSESAKSSGSFNSIPAFDVPSIELPPDLPPLGNLPPLNEIPSNFSSIPQVPPASFGQQPPIAVAPFARPLPSVPQADIPAASEVQPIPEPAPLAPPPDIAPMPAAPEPQLPDLEPGSELGDLPPGLGGQPINPDGEEPGSYEVNPDLGSIEQFPTDQIAQDPAAGEEGENTPDQDASGSEPNQPEAVTDDNLAPESRNWYAKVQTLTRQADLSLQEVTTSLPYPKEACEDKYEGTTVLGALIGPDGQLVPEGELGLTANPEILESSSYTTLNQAAIEGVAGFSSYQATGKYQAFVYRIPFNYTEEDCPRASPTPSPSASSPRPSASPAKTQTPTPSPSVSAEPSPTSTPTPASDPDPLPSVSAEPTPLPAPADPEPTPSSEPTLGTDPMPIFEGTPDPQPSPAAEES